MNACAESDERIESIWRALCLFRRRAPRAFICSIVIMISSSSSGGSSSSSSVSSSSSTTTTTTIIIGIIPFVVTPSAASRLMARNPRSLGSPPGAALSTLYHSIYIYTHIMTQLHNYSCVHIYVCVCVYIYIYIHTYIHACIHTYIHTSIHTHIHTYIHPYTSYYSILIILCYIRSYHIVIYYII